MVDKSRNPVVVFNSCLPLETRPANIGLAGAGGENPYESPPHGLNRMNVLNALDTKKTTEAGAE
jgi:hypothetical protein